jgi:hypothetical protein
MCWDWKKLLNYWRFAEHRSDDQLNCKPLLLDPANACQMGSQASLTLLLPLQTAVQAINWLFGSSRTRRTKIWARARDTLVKKKSPDPYVLPRKMPPCLGLPNPTQWHCSFLRASWTPPLTHLFPGGQGKDDQKSRAMAGSSSSSSCWSFSYRVVARQIVCVPRARARASCVARCHHAARLEKGNGVVS